MTLTRKIIVGLPVMLLLMIGAVLSVAMAACLRLMRLLTGADIVPPARQLEAAPAAPPAEAWE